MTYPRLLLTLLLSTLFSLSVCAERESTAAIVDHIIQVADAEVAERLALLDQSIVDYRLDPSVRSRISMYVERWRHGSARILGRTTRYFPYFSERLADAGMPDALKYLSITESALRPFAFSHAGAAGLWQLMPGTARELGLEVTDTVDERLDLVIGTAAGLRYLQIQYERYGDWALAMAAYNSGPGRVNRAKRRSGSNNYWKLRKFLPRETRSYVPGFIAATYLATFYRLHEITPATPDLDLQLTETVRVHSFLSLHRVAMVTGLRPDYVIELNPAYLAGYLPPSYSGRPLRLPSRVVPAMRTYLEQYHEDGVEPPIPWLSPRLDQSELDSDQYYQAFKSTPSVYDTSHTQLAGILGVSPNHLLMWSGYGELDSLQAGQWWTYYKLETPLAFGPADRDASPPVAPLLSAMASAVTPNFRRSKIEDQMPSPNDPTESRPRGIKRVTGDIWRWIKE